MSKKTDKIAKSLGADRVMDPIALALENRQLREAFAVAKRELAEHKRLFEMQHDRSRHAELLWREHTGNPNISPDLGTLLDWLIMRGDRWQAIVAAARKMDTYEERGGCRIASGPAPLDVFKELHNALNRYDMFYEGIKL
jgi:hypothetical protein